MAYTLSPKFDIAQQARAVEILDIAARGGASFRRTMGYLANEGLSYGRGAQQDDFRRAGALYFYKSPETRQAAEQKYDQFDEPFRKAHNLTAHEAGILQTALRTGQPVPEDLEEEYEEYETEYEMAGI